MKRKGRREREREKREREKERGQDRETIIERKKEKQRGEGGREGAKEREMPTLVLHVDESLNDSMMEVKKHWNAIVKLLPNNVMVS